MSKGRVDFRAEAAYRSEAVLAQHGVDPFDDLRGLGVSLCVLIDPDGLERSRALDRRTVLIQFLALGQFFAVLGASAWIAGSSLNPPDWVLSILVVIGFLSAMLMLLIFHVRRKREQARLLEELRGRPNPIVPSTPPGADGPTPYFIVDIQRRRGEVTFALYRDDQGILVPDPEHGCVLIESRGYRHIIHPADVTLFNPVSNSGAIGVDIVYEVEGVEVPLHMFSHSLGGSVKNYFGLSPKNPLAHAAGVALSG